MTDFQSWMEREWKHSAGPPNLVVIHHMLTQGAIDKTGAVDRRVFDGKKKRDEDPKEIASWAVLRCQEDAASFSGKQRYKIILHREGHPAVRYILPIDPPGDEIVEGDMERKLPAERDELLLQLLSDEKEQNRKRDEFFLRGFEMLNRQHEALNKQLVDLLEEQSKTFQAEYVRRLNERTERKTTDIAEMELQMEREERERQGRASDLVLEKLGLLGEAMISRASGGQGTLRSADPRLRTMKAFLGSLDDDQMREIMSRLRPEQQLAVDELASALFHDEKQKQPDKDEIPPNGTGK